MVNIPELAIPELAAGRLSLFADTSTVGRSIGRVFKGGDKDAARAGDRWGKLMSKSFDKTKPDMGKLADDVARAEKRIAAETKRSANAQALAKAKVEAAQAKLNEAIEKGGKESARAKTAAIQLMTAQNNVEKETLRATDALDKLNRELDETQKAYKAGEDASENYAKGWRGLGAKLKNTVQGAMDHSLNQKGKAEEHGDSAADSYANGFGQGLGTQLAARTVAAVVLAGIAAKLAAKAAGEAAGNSFVQGFTSSLAKLSGGRALFAMGKHFAEFAGNLDKTSPKFALLSSAVLTLGSAAIGATGNLFSLGGSILSMTPAALVLPGIIGAGAIAFGAFTLAMLDAQTVLADLGPAFNALQDYVSAAFWNQAAQPLRELAYHLLPTTQYNLGLVSEALGRFTAATANYITTSVPLQAIADIYDYLLISIENLHGAIQPVIDSVITLGTVGASYLPALSTWIVKLATDFNTWLQAAEADGRLRGWIEQGIQSFKDMGSVIFQTGALLYNLTNAFQDAGFNATLGGLAQGLERINAALTGPVGQGVLANIFGGARAGLDGAYIGVSNLANSFVSFAPILERIMALGGQFTGQFLTNISKILENPTFQRGLIRFFEGALQGIMALEPAMGPLAEKFGTLAQTVGMFLENFGPVLSEFIQKLAPVFDRILIAIQPLIPLLADVLVAALTALMPYINGLVDFLIDHGVPALEWLARTFIENKEVLAPLIAGFALLIAAILPVLPVIGSIISFALSLITAFSGSAGLSIAIGGVVSAIGGFIVAALPIIGVIALIVVSIIGMIYSWRKLGEVITNVWNWAKQKIVETVAWFVSVLMPWFVSKIAELQYKWQLFGNAVAAVWQSIKDKINAFWVWFSTSLSNWLAEKLIWIGNKFQDMKNRVSGIWNDFRGMLSAGWDWIKSETFDPFVKFVTQDIPNAFRQTKDGIARIWDGIKKVVRDPIEKVLDVVINRGLIDGYNGLNDFWSGKDIPHVSLPPGFATGGYTGPGAKYKPAGIVHADEFVVRKASRRKFEKENPGYLDHINRTGTLPTKADTNSPGFNHGAYAMGPPGGPSGGIWSALQQAASNAGRLYVSNRGVGGVNTESVAKAWMGQSALDIRMGEGSPGLNVVSGGPGGWGFYVGNTMYLNPNGPSSAADKAGTLRHELGHALSLDHIDSTASIMHPQMRGGNWPHPGDYSTLRRVWGNPGKGVRKYSAAEAGAEGGGFDVFGFISEKLIGPFTGAYDRMKSQFAANRFVEMPLGIAKHGKDELVQWATDKINAVGNFVGDVVDKGKVTAWVTTALAKKGLASPGNILSGVNRAFKESGGNPGITQSDAVDDVNSRTGNHARGLMQVIPTTFAANKEPGHDDIFDPIDNLLASINYTMKRYGSLQAGWNLPGGYAEGGLVKPALYDKGGLIKKGVQLIDHQRSTPDRVLTDTQWNDMHTIAENSSSKAPVINQYINDVPWPDPEKAARKFMDAASFDLQGM